ncbi:MAG: ATP phosphoribosyltransferase regulatory subunit [Promethearchaeota archaeon]|jgi:histidyl-tRNA synthetase
MIRGTRVIVGREADDYVRLIDRLRVCLKYAGYSEIIIPSLWEQQTFVDKAGPEIMNQMYAFEDKKGRPICLIPEVTAIIQEIWNGGLSKTVKKPHRVFYVNRCYRYEKPQKGRYREFNQLGVEILGGKAPQDKEEILGILNKCLDITGDFNYNISLSVKRGLDYYVEDGFEVECPDLGAQKQVAGGGRYNEGIGFALGLDRLLLAIGDAK